MYLQSMFSSRIRKIMYTPVNPSFTLRFYNIKVGFKGVKIISACFRDLQFTRHFAFDIFSVDFCCHGSIIM